LHLNFSSPVAQNLTLANLYLLHPQMSALNNNFQDIIRQMNITNDFHSLIIIIADLHLSVLHFVKLLDRHPKNEHLLHNMRSLFNISKRIERIIVNHPTITTHQHSVLLDHLQSCQPLLNTYNFPIL
jgi:hypothetical protein